ncbi:uncharacterized protein LOC141765563 [Sebastes fasciatus]|uniref:uncharacterized protein LOC141765563 n=1 Tax=Sebastes fasciatus TaxID=394691 RepID=UPI003D9DD84C
MSNKDNNLKTIKDFNQNMEFWPENPGQTPLYSKFGTVPGRNCTHNYQDRHQVPQYPLYYGEQQDQSRESSYWTVPGSRTGGAPQEYTNWTDQDQTAPASSQFPFILDRHAQQHQDLGDYHQQHEARDREWTAAQRAAREYERGFLREGWQRRWEPCGPVRYNREVPAKRSDSSYRELEAWAARYSHSLPRRRRIEAELRGASQGLPESSRTLERDSRSETDPRVAALQQVRQSASFRESGLWDRGGRQQAPTYYPSQTPATDTSQEKNSYQPRMFSQPPGYIAPPPYDSPHKGSPVLHHCDTSWEQEGKRQTYWSQPTLQKKQHVDLQDHREGEKEEFAKPDGNQKSFPEGLEGLIQDRRQAIDALQASSPFSIQETHMQHEGELSLQQSQVLQAVENKKINKEPSSKVIEGRKFRLNKKTGGMTIFCLVSRIAGPAETPSLPLCTSQGNIQNTEVGGVSKGLWVSSGINQTHKLADEVDFRAPTLTEQSNASDARKAKQKEMPTCIESEMLSDKLSNKAELDVVSQEKVKTDDADSTIGRQVARSVQPVSVKYPLWREPSFSSRAETESSSTCLKANIEEGESDVLHNQENKFHPIDVEVRRLDIKTDTDSEDSEGRLVIKTTCVVVKIELIPSPKKEHVHYLHTEHSPLDVQSTISPESNSQLDQDATTDQNTETNPLHTNERPETEPDSDIMEQQTPEGESEISSVCMSSSSVSEGETLEERAERILGIPLQDCVTKQQPEEATSPLDSYVEDQEVEPSPIKDNDIDDAVEQIPEDTGEEEQSQSRLEVGQTEDAVCLRENDDTKDQAANEDGGDFAGLRDQVSIMSDGNDTETDIESSPDIEITEDSLLIPASEEDCEPALSLTLSSSDLTPLMHISESNIEGGPDPELIPLSSAENLALQPETSSLLPASIDFTTNSTPNADQSPSPSPLHSVDHTAETVSDVEDQDEEGETPQLINNEISDTLEDITKDMTEEQQFESDQPDDAACVIESNATDDQQTTEDDPTDHIMEQTLRISKEDAIEVDILQQQLERVQAEDFVYVKHSYLTEDQLPEEVNEDPAGLLEPTIYQENVTDSQTEVNILQQQFDNGQEEDAHLKESYMTEERSQKEADEDPTGLLELTLSTENATDSQTQIEIEILQDTEQQTEASDSSPPSPSDSDCEVSQSPLDVLSPSELPTPTHTSNESDTECVSFLEMDSVCSSALNPDAAPAAGIPETVPPPLHLDSCEESLQFSSSSCTDSPRILLSSSSTPPPQEGSGSIDPASPLKEEPQYPKSLWDAVNRIRKHTAPDSENEEEEVSELWDPESAGEDLCRPGVVVDINSGRIVFDGAGQSEVSTEGVEENLCHEERSGHAEEDTLSCSSTCSHGSGDTVIVADEDEVEETPPDAGTESKTGNDEEFQMAEGERCCSAEVKDEIAAKEEGDNDGDESVNNESSQSEEWPVEVANKTAKAVEMKETELEENQEEVQVKR